MIILDHNECDTKQDQHDCNCRVIVKPLLKQFVEQNSDNSRRNAGHQNMKPQDKDIFFYPGSRTFLTQWCHIILLAKRPDLAPEENDNRKNRAKLDYDFKHAVKFITDIKRQYLIQKDHVSGTADWQPLCNTLNDTEKHRL